MRSSRKFPLEAKFQYLQGMAGSNRVRFVATIPHGKHQRQLVLDIKPDLIVKIAEAIKATGNGQCSDPRYYDGLGTVGHAIWHVENPEAVMPCLRNHNTIIDIESTPTLPEPVPLADFVEVAPLPEPRPLEDFAPAPLPDMQPVDEDDDPYEGSWREAADNEGARIAHRHDGED